MTRKSRGKRANEKHRASERAVHQRLIDDLDAHLAGRSGDDAKAGFAAARVQEFAFIAAASMTLLLSRDNTILPVRINGSSRARTIQTAVMAHMPAGMKSDRHQAAARENTKMLAIGKQKS